MIVIKKNIAERYFDEEDTIKFKCWIVKNQLTMGDVAYKLGYTYSYLYLIMNGKRPITSKFLKKLKEIGYEM